MSETVWRLRHEAPGVDENNDPIPGAVSRTPLRARAIAPGASRRNIGLTRSGESIELTVYFSPAPDLRDTDELEVRGQVFKVRTSEWRSAFGTGRSGMEAFAIIERG